MEPTQEQLDAMITIVVKAVNDVIEASDKADVPTCTALCNLISACVDSLVRNDHAGCVHDVLVEILSDFTGEESGAPVEVAPPVGRRH